MSKAEARERVSCRLGSVTAKVWWPPTQTRRSCFSDDTVQGCRNQGGAQHGLSTLDNGSHDLSIIRSLSESCSLVSSHASRTRPPAPSKHECIDSRSARP